VTPLVECLRCGEQHRLHRSSLRQLVDGECPRCGYLGWARASDLTETSRRALRSRPPRHRRLRLVA
jgi:Zn ribbon nucleic-acid-binding protein